MSLEQSPTRILLVISNLTLGGAERQVIEIANHLADEDFEVYVAILSEHAPLASRLEHPERLIKIPKRHKYDFSVVMKLRRLIKQNQIQLVHGFLFDAEIAARLAGFTSGIVVVGSERNAAYRYPRVQWLLYHLTKWTLSACVPNSQAGKALNQATFSLPDDRYTVIYNGVDVERFSVRERDWSQTRIKPPEAKFVLGMVGSFKPQKNHFYLLDIVAELKKLRRDFVVLVAGTTIFEGDDASAAYFESIKSKIDDLDLTDQIQLVGAVGETEYFYPLCDLTLLTSKHEGLPNVALESMACGVPILATDVSDNRHIIPNGQVGFVLAENDAPGFARVIHETLSDEDKLNKMSKAARDWMVEKFSTVKMAQNFANLYRRLIEEAK